MRMAADQEQSPRKLVYLRDHTPKLRNRSPRQERRTTAAPRPELASEAAWLGRSLILLSVVTLMYWLAVATGAVLAESEESWRWTLSHSLAHLFLAASSGMAGRLLLQNGTRAPLFVAVAAGGLVVIALEGLTRMVIVGGLAEISLGARSDILTKAGVLAAGIWAGSYALRADRRVE
jgi:hypothetical protein